MTKKKQTDTQIMQERSRDYGPVSEQMAVIGSIQMELTRYCLERNQSSPPSSMIFPPDGWPCSKKADTQVIGIGRLLRNRQKRN